MHILFILSVTLVANLSFAGPDRCPDQSEDCLSCLSCCQNYYKIASLIKEKPYTLTTIEEMCGQPGDEQKYRMAKRREPDYSEFEKEHSLAPGIVAGLCLNLGALKNISPTDSYSSCVDSCGPKCPKKK